MLVRFEAVKQAKAVATTRGKARATAQRKLDKVVRFALANGWTPESFERQIAKRPKLYVPKTRKVILNAVARLSRGR